MDCAGAAPARLFLALWPGPATRAAIVRERDAWSWPAGARPVRDDRLHLTLHFIGAVPRARLPEIARGLALPPGTFRRFELRPGGTAVWRHGIAVQEVDAVPSLVSLHQALATRLRALALPVEARPFAPHVTLARHAAGAQPPTALATWRWPVHGWRLVESLPAGRGYRAIAHYR